MSPFKHGVTLETTYTRVRTHAHTRTGTHAHARTHTHTHARTHTHTHIRTQAHKHTHTYTHATNTGSEAEVLTAAHNAQAPEVALPGGRGGGGGAGGGAAFAPAAGARGGGLAGSFSIPLQHVGVHWVQGTPQLVGALARVPLRLQLCCAHERPPAAYRGPSSPHHPHLQQQPWTTASVVGAADVDLSQLVAPAHGKQLPARWGGWGGAGWGGGVPVDPFASMG